MATVCESCKSQAGAALARALKTSRLASSSTRATPLYTARPAGVGTTRQFSSSVARRLIFRASTITDSYRVLGASETLYKACAAPADYHISKKMRTEKKVRTLVNGEEMGAAKTINEWHTEFRLPVSFNTWSHVTMLHLYLINARLRCFERDTYRAWQQQLIDHFFFDAEQKMHLDHEITSSGLRQRYLKDLFVQWRGLLLAYDEGLVAGDAILASAVWRNLCKGVPDTDPRALLAVVGWMRCSLTELEAISDANFPQGVTQILATPVWSFWTQVEDTFRGGPGRHLGLNQRLPGNEASQTATTEAAQKAAAVEAAIRAARRVAQR